MRSTWGLRLVAAMLVVALLPVAAVPVGPSAPHIASLSYANWLRAQLDAPASPAIEAAFDAAVEDAPDTMDAFLDAFAATYAVEAAGVPLARFFDAPDDLGADALLQFLRSQFHRLGADGLVPLVTLVAASVVALGSPERAKAAVTIPAQVFSRGIVRTVCAAAVTAVAVPLRLRSAARPNGP